MNLNQTVVHEPELLRAKLSSGGAGVAGEPWGRGYFIRGWFEATVVLRIKRKRRVRIGSRSESLPQTSLLVIK